jgi:hypothetical protein
LAVSRNGAVSKIPAVLLLKRRKTGHVGTQRGDGKLLKGPESRVQIAEHLWKQRQTLAVRFRIYCMARRLYVRAPSWRMRPQPLKTSEKTLLKKGSYSPWRRYK